MEALLNINFLGGGVHMLPRPYKFSHGLCLNNFLKFWIIGNHSDKVPLFRYINWYDNVYHLIIGRKVLGDMAYLMRSVKRAAEAVGIWTEDNWDVKRGDSLYTMVSRRFVFKRNKRFDSLSWSSVVIYVYTWRGYIIVYLNEQQE